MPNGISSTCRERLTYHTTDRRADIIWTWKPGSRLNAFTLSDWRHPAEARSQPMTAEERATVLEHVLRFANRELGPTPMDE